ncbi:glutaredoxin [Sphaeroforma arctica JP610]|uniref:Glutaredoxin n=1 Tax=Sphaeroforma arctica JP610 TaxID=667725 RepID=A0A0L0GEF0_9EUKA|nr:glutaredoxin [Sphaeroforma arctica JP610]KNC86613.1 glutaredoxin [Sphaeroforma arctica JP610]|eukprot:XP_014160515.1 glutaredoxin [Sphaeroforma arctica JP610]
MFRSCLLRSSRLAVAANATSRTFTTSFRSTLLQTRASPSRSVLLHRGVNANALLTKYARTYTSDTDRDIKAKIEEVIKANKLVVFMKGVPEAPQCGFSNAVSQILSMHGLKDYVSFDILQDQELRQAIKEYSDWPTIPQVYIDGEFVGGCDIILELHKTGELINVLKEAGIESTMPTEE